jgi:acetyltransferase
VQHFLRPLLVPNSVALVGASDRAGSLGRSVYENLIGGKFAGDIYAVNPGHRKVFGQKAYATVRAIGKPVDLVVITAPAATIPGLLDDMHPGVRAAVVMSAPDASDPAAARTWRRDVCAAGKKRDIRLVGPGAFGVIRTDIGLNATFGAAPTLPGRLALVSQSGAVCTAMLDFAAPMRIGFSTVISLGGAIDVGFGELLDAMLQDPATDGILLYIESVGDARGFLSALRAAARIKPVIVLKAGRSLETGPDTRNGEAMAPTPDVVFDAALQRAGTVRVRTYTQLFAAARILAMGRIPGGNRLAIVSNGRGPGLMAADSAIASGVALAGLEPATVQALDALLPKEIVRANPVDVRADAPPARLAAAVAATLSDPQVDAVLALHVERPATPAIDAARAVAAVARGSAKPVLASWLGALDRQGVHEALDAGGVANFYTPENAVDAFSFLAAYRRNQEWLLEVPPPQADPAPPDLATAEHIRESAASRGRAALPLRDIQALLAAFGIDASSLVGVDTLTEANAAARRLGFPVQLALEMEGRAVSPSRGGIRNGRALALAYGDLAHELPADTRADWSGRVIVRRDRGGHGGRYAALAASTDPVFGPVIAFGASERAVIAHTAATVMLPPLNRRLALDLIAAASLQHAASKDALVDLLLRISALVCALPWVRELAFDPIVLTSDRLEIGGVRMTVEPKRKCAPGYRHMAIHPYPTGLESVWAMTDGTSLRVRPIRPEDANLERDFVASLSEQTRYFRFFYRLHQLTPAMLARFTQVDYDRELALLALAPDPAAAGADIIVGISRYIANYDRESAEFAVVVTDAWHGRGVGRMLMERIITCARKRGFKRLEGVVLRANVGMLKFSESLGFEVHDDPNEPEQVTVVLDLSGRSA